MQNRDVFDKARAELDAAVGTAAPVAVGSFPAAGH